MPRLLLVLLIFLAAAGLPAQPAVTGAALPAITREQAAAALSVLENPQTRDALIAALQSLAAQAPPASPEHPDTPNAPRTAGAVQHPPAAPAPAGETKGAVPAASPPSGKKAAPAPLAIPLQPDSLAAQVLVGLASRVTAASEAIARAVRAIISFPLLSVWIWSVWTNTYLHQLFLAVAWRLVLVVGAGLAAEWLAIRLLARPRAGLERLARRCDGVGLGEPSANQGVDEAEARAEAGEMEFGRLRHPLAWHVRRLGLAFVSFLLDLVPVVVFAAVANGLLGAGLGEGAMAKLAILAVANSYVVARVLLSSVRMVAGAECAQLRLLPASDPTARYVMLWARRIVGFSVFGYTTAEVALLFGLYPSLHLALIKLVSLVVHLFLVVIVLQQRRAVRALLAAPDGASGPVSTLRNVVAANWHYVAIFYVLALWAVWASGVQHAFTALLRFCAVAVVVIAAAWALDRALWRAVERHVRIREDLAERFPGLERRVHYYFRGFRKLVSSVIAFVALVLLLEFWGIDAVSWFTSDSLGGRVLGALAVIGITVLTAAFLWEAVNVAMERHLGRLSRAGHVTRSARLRTLLPMMRATLFIVIGVFVGLTVLSQIGVNIGPLLAGAGIIGIAIGFGSQKLVQDIITGLFLLLENAMQVGDVVSLGGLGGVVENLSIRTIRLRDKDGSVHIVPFSSVTSVTNMTRDFSYALFNVGVAYKEDVDRVIEVLKEIAREMRKDPEWSAMIRDDLEVWGLDQFAASSIVIVCRLRTGPSQRWAVMREFNRRMKRRFDELGIEIPFPHQKLVLDQPVSFYHLREGANETLGVRP